MMLTSFLLMMRPLPGEGQAGNALEPAESALASAIRYVEAKHGLQGLGYIHVDKLAVRDQDGRPIALMRARQDEVARATGLQVRSVTSACDIEYHGVLFSAELQEISGNHMVVSASYSQRTGTGWGATTHVLRLPASHPGSQVEVISTFNAHGPCSLLQ
jgi:hypothetical protein